MFCSQNYFDFILNNHIIQENIDQKGFCYDRKFTAHWWDLATGQTIDRVGSSNHIPWGHFPTCRQMIFLNIQSFFGSHRSYSSNKSINARSSVESIGCFTYVYAEAI